jgi:hypothetical protein
VDERTELGKGQATYIRTQSRRTFRESPTAEGLTVFRFDSGQRCFQEHQTRPRFTPSDRVTGAGRSALPADTPPPPIGWRTSPGTSSGEPRH